ncbi:MAG: transglutaminase domain-containing protein [Ginsengibacter sp.]
MKFLLTIFVFCQSLVMQAQSDNEYSITDRAMLGISTAEASSTDSIAAYIKNHFISEQHKVRAVYTWVANNIEYSTDSLHRVILNEDRYEKVSIAFRRKKGVCENFAAIFNDICIKSGLNSFVVDGYTNMDRSGNKAGHAWNAVSVNTKWYLYDATWDARFAAQAGTKYFQLSPQEFIQTHMPFDPLFQFLNYPLTYQEFNKGYSAGNKSRAYFNHPDSINLYQRQDSFAQFISTFIRIQNNGTPSSLVALKLSQLKMETEIVYQGTDADLYNAAVSDYTAALTDFKSFLNYRNNRFLPTKSSNEINAMLDAIERKIANANTKLKVVNTSKATLTLNTGDIEKMLDDLGAYVKEQQIFLKNYLGSAK